MSNTGDIKVIRSKRKTVALSIAPDASIIVKAPRFTPMFFINSFVKKHQDWISQQQALIKKKIVTQKKELQHGDLALFLGIQHEVIFGDFLEIAAKDNKILFPKAMQFIAKKQIDIWYQQQARKIIRTQVDHFAAEMKTHYTGLTFSDTSSQWGSCTAENKLQFSWRLIMAPILVVNYVVVHELAHTFEKNHSQRFWRVVAKYCPSYQRQRNWLKRQGNTLID